jgi:hypothetical protein
VSDDPIALLERELVSAARRRAAAGPVPAVLPWPRARRRRIRAGDALSAAAAAGAVVVALAALALLGGGGGGHPASTAAATPRDKLIATLAVLRRPQTRADLTLPELSRARTPHAVFQPLLGTPDRPLIRLATTAPWGAKVYVVPFRPLARGRVRSGWTAYAPLNARAAQRETITVFGGPGGRGETMRGLTAQDIAQGRGVVDEAGSGPTRHSIRFLVVVPDGVAKVTVVFAQPPVPGANTIESVDTRAAHGNVAAFQELGTQPARPWLMTWESRTGKVIKRIPLPTALG